MTGRITPIISTFDEKEIPSLFPYQIKNRNKFYNRQHPVGLNPNSLTYDQYWQEQYKKCIEGVWIDDEGTWVYMPGKLYFHINVAVIEDENRKKIQPRLRDNEWIMFYYFMMVDGFSGFERDNEYTCHYLVKQMEDDPDELDEVQKDGIPETAYRDDGELKKYVDPWEYLTRHYLVTHKHLEPLGRPIYHNQRQNGVILSARGCAKSINVFVGDFTHEFLFAGKQRLDDGVQVNSRLNFAMGCSNTVQLDRSIANVSAFYNNMPGQYRYPKTRDGKDVPKAMGPFYKRVQGTWKTGATIKHIVKNKDNTKEIEGSMVQMVALTPDKNTIASGDRFRRIYAEESGFLKNLLEIWAASLDSLRIGNNRIGSFIALGTGGDMEAIKPSKTIFENPSAYNVASIPNYWKNINKRIGLFVPRYYADEQYKDKHGNTRIQLSYDAVMRQREKDRKDKDSVSFDTDIMFNPVKPDEMLRPSSGGWLPKQEAAEQLSTIESWDLFDRKAMIGEVKWDSGAHKGVRFDVDFKRELRPILDWNIDMKKADLDGAFIVYEQPAERVPENLYWVIYDPAAQSGAGESLHSIIVYKGFWTGNEATMSDTIVAEWIGRLDKLDDNYDLCVKIAKYFNARIFPEINIAGFVEYMGRMNYYYMLEPDAYLLEKEINPKGRRSHYKAGFRMDHRKKLWCLKKLKDWLMEGKEFDAVTGLTVSKTINHIFSPRILDEIINHNDSDNFDHISSLLGMMLLLGKIDREAVEVEVEEEDEMKNFEDWLAQQNVKPPSRASFLNY